VTALHLEEIQVCNSNCVVYSDCNSRFPEIPFFTSLEIREFFEKKFRKFGTSFVALLALSCLFWAVGQ